MNKLLNLLHNVRTEANHNKKVFFVVVFALLIFAPISLFAFKKSEPPKNSEVLGTEIQNTPTLTPTEEPTPTSTPIPTIIRKVATLTNTPIPTPTNSSSQASSPTSTPTPTQGSNSNPNPTGTPILTPTATPTPIPTNTPTPTPAGLNIKIGIDYAGAKSNDSYDVTIDQGANAWEAIKKAIGIDNLKYTDYGGNLGIFITGFNEINADPNSQYYEFRVNGVSSNVGVSSYICNNGDKLDFVLTSF